MGKGARSLLAIQNDNSATQTENEAVRFCAQSLKMTKFSLIYSSFSARRKLKQVAQTFALHAIRACHHGIIAMAIAMLRPAVLSIKTKI